MVVSRDVEYAGFLSGDCLGCSGDCVGSVSRYGFCVGKGSVGGDRGCVGFLAICSRVLQWSRGWCEG